MVHICFKNSEEVKWCISSTFLVFINTPSLHSNTQGIEYLAGPITIHWSHSIRSDLEFIILHKDTFTCDCRGLNCQPSDHWKKAQSAPDSIGDIYTGYKAELNKWQWNTWGTSQSFSAAMNKEFWSYWSKATEKHAGNSKIFPGTYRLQLQRSTGWILGNSAVISWGASLWPIMTQRHA